MLLSSRVAADVDGLGELEEVGAFTREGLSKPVGTFAALRLT